MKRSYYSRSIADFLAASPEEILGILSQNNEFDLSQGQRDAWKVEIDVLQDALQGYQGKIYFEYSIPRMGRRIDVLLLIRSAIFVLEFKVGEKRFPSYAIDQVWDYALDLKNFHESSHEKCIVPILVATEAKGSLELVNLSPENDKVFFPIKSDVVLLREIIKNALLLADDEKIDVSQWEAGRYHPTPTIIEAAMALYEGHSVEDISRNDAGAINLRETSAAITNIIEDARLHSKKALVFVTGVPGAGKTLVGLNIANKHTDKSNELYSVFLSGNGPLVAILREALVRNEVKKQKDAGKKIRKMDAMNAVKQFVQNVHNFRDESLEDQNPPVEHVALFDEAQRAWNLEQTVDFMRRKKHQPNFSVSEPEFLISCLDRHPDWAVVVCLVGGGQEIHIGEAGISEWIDSLNRSFPDWDVHISSRLTDAEYGAGESLKKLSNRKDVFYNDSLHLSVSMRSFRAEDVSLLVKNILDRDVEMARDTLIRIQEKYPIILTRDVAKAKAWLKNKARGSERYGIMVSSQAERLKPHAIDVKSPMNPIHWFLDGKDDVRSSYYLEDVATEFHVQGLELDWGCVVWDADLRYSDDGWQHYSFRGSKWLTIRKEERKKYLKNAYRVLLTRARQGMVIVVPPGDENDATRNPKFYDSTFEYLKGIGFEVL